MKPLAILLLFSLNLTTEKSTGQNVAINPTGTPPNSNAMLDINSSSKGILIPRVNLVDSANPVSGVKPNGLMVWNDNNSFDKGIGFYYWMVNKWRPVVNIYYPGDAILIDTNTNIISGKIVSLSQNGIIPAPTSQNRRATFNTDFNGIPAWRREDLTTYYIEKF